MRLILMLLVAMGMFAQTPPSATAPIIGTVEAAVIHVKTLTGDSFNRLAGMLKVFNVGIQADEKLRIILVYAPPNIVAQIKKVVEELDRPGSEAAIGRNIEMTLTFLRCSVKPIAGGGELPADMEAVAKQLRAATPYKNIEVWETLPLRLQEGKVTEQTIRLPSTLPDIPGAQPTAHIRIHPEAVTKKESGRFVRFDRFQINQRIPYSTSAKNATNSLVSTQWQYLDAGLNTAGDFKEGQKTVLGKLSSAEDETAVFVVIALKVLD